MKLLWLSILVAGLALAKEDEKTSDLQDIQGRQKTGVDTAAAATVAQNAVANTQSLVTDVTDNVLLQIGNVLRGIGAIDLKNIATDGTKTGLGAAGAAGAVAAGGLTALGGAVAAANGIKTAILTLAGSGLDIANFVLAIIALAFLIAYLVHTEGDIKGLLGYESGSGSGSGSGYYRREDYEPYNAYSNYVSTARAFLDAPIVQQLTAMVHDAITKYD
ncbi:uncharacterized protein [Panulirus ornatus]